jgi:hypothetical protein
MKDYFDVESLVWSENITDEDVDDLEVKEK